MGKKKGGKGKGKGKANKPAKKKDELTHLEKEIFFLKVREIENKIAWKRRMSARLSEGADLHEKAFEEEHAKGTAIEKLEDAIKQQVATNDGYSDAISNVANDNGEAELDNMAAGFRKLDELRSAYDAELEVLRREVQMLESFNPKKLEQRIEELERQLASEDMQSNVLNSVELDRRREKYLREVLPHILEDQAMMFQDGLKDRMPIKFQRVAEESRWRKMGLDDLLRVSKSLDARNEDLGHRLKSAQESMTIAKEAALQASADLQDLKVHKSDLVKRSHVLREQNKTLNILKQRTQRLDNVADELGSRLFDEHRLQHGYVQNLKDNESSILKCEKMLSEQKELSQFLWNVVNQAQCMIGEEAMHSMALTMSEWILPKDLLMKLEELFDRASKAICDLRSKEYVIVDDVTQKHIEYDDIGSYEMGSLGLLPAIKEDDDSSSWESIDSSPTRELGVRRKSSIKVKNRSVDHTAAKILSDLGLMSRFRRKSTNCYVLRRYRLGEH